MAQTFEKGARMDKFSTGNPSVSDALVVVKNGAKNLQGMAQESDDIFEQIAAMIEVIRVAQKAFTG